MSERLPYLQLYTLDRLAETRSLVPDQKALYFDLLMYMHQSRRRGFLAQPNGKPYSYDQLAQMTGFSTDMVSRLLQELLDAEVISSTSDGIPYCPWMVKAEQKRLLCKAAGKKGGNPTLKGLSKGPPNPSLNGKSEDEDLFDSRREEGGPGEGERAGLRAEFLRVFRLDPKTQTEEERADLDRMVDVLVLKGAVLKDIEVRLGKYRKTWPNVACTPRAFIKWFDLMAPEASSPKGESDAERIVRENDERAEAAWLALSAEEQERALRPVAHGKPR